MKLIEVTGGNGKRIAIPVQAVIGVTEFDGRKIKGFSDNIRSFIGTGADSADEPNGWYLSDDYETVKQKLLDS